MASMEIHAVRSLTGDQPPIRRLIEDEGETFKAGTPVEVDVSEGAVIAWDGTTIAGKIAGFSLSAGQNLTTQGVGKTTTEYDVPNQPLAQGIPLGAKMSDGKTDIEVAVPTTVFLGECVTGQTPAVTDVGGQHGLTIDAGDSHWNVDLTKTTTSGAEGASEAVLTIVRLRPDLSTRAVEFTILAAAAQNVV